MYMYCTITIEDYNYVDIYIIPAHPPKDERSKEMQLPLDCQVETGQTSF